MRRSVLALASSLGCAGCAATGSLGSGLPNGPPAAPVRAPLVDETGRYGIWQVIGSSSSGAVGGIIGDREDGAAWFSDVYNGLYRIGMDGVVAYYALPYGSGSFEPFDVVKGVDGRFYMASSFGTTTAIGAFAPGPRGGGHLTVYRVPGGDTMEGNGFALGSDGNVWFTELAHIAKISTSGTVTQYPYPSGANANAFAPVVAGADGNIWFTEYLGTVPPGTGIVANIVPSTGKITEYDVSKVCPDPGTLTRGPGTTLFATCGTAAPNTLFEVAESGKATALASNPYGTAFGINHSVLGPDGAYYVTPFVTKEFLVRFDPRTKGFFKVRAPSWIGGSGFGPLAVGPDDNLWSVDDTGAIVIDLFNVVTVKPTTLHLLAPGGTAVLVAIYVGTKSRPLSARTTDPSVVTVAPGSKPQTFVATAAGRGYAEIVVRDPIGNRFTVEVTVR